MTSNAVVYVLITTFLASAVEAIEMVTIVVGVGATRSWRASLVGAAAGLGVLAAVIAGLGAALSAIPINALRVVVGALLLIFGLQWFTKGVRRVAARGFAGMREQDLEDEHASTPGFDWTAFVLSFRASCSKASRSRSSSSRSARTRIGSAWRSSVAWQRSWSSVASAHWCTVR